MKTKHIDFKDKILIQSMTNTKTKDIDKTLEQIKALAKYGCDLVRVAVFDDQDANSLEIICKKSPLPIIADIHFNFNYALKAIDSGVSKIRLNPGNISNPNEIKQIIDAAKRKKIWIRLGVNSGSIPEKYLIKNKNNIVKSMLNLMEDYLKIFNKEKFNKLVLSFKCSDPLLNIKVNEAAFKKFKYPFHIGVTEAGTLLDATIKSTIGLAPLLIKGIGSTIRISISGDPCEEVKIAHKILNNLKLENNRINIISCPTCGRLNYDIFSIVAKVEKYCEFKFFPLTISILGCVVNGIGEGKHADIGLAGSGDKVIVFKDGKIYKHVSKNDAFKEIKKLIDDKYKMFLKRN